MIQYRPGSTHSTSLRICNLSSNKQKKPLFKVLVRILARIHSRVLALYLGLLICVYVTEIAVEFCAITESSLGNIACVLIHSLYLLKQTNLPTLLRKFLILSAVIVYTFQVIYSGNSKYSLQIVFPSSHPYRLAFSVGGTRTQPLICVGCSVHYWVSCAIDKGGFLEIAFVVVVVVIDRHLPRFEALAYVLPHFDALTYLMIRVSSAFIFQTFAEVCYSVFVNRSSFKSVPNFRKAYISKSLLKVCYRSVFK